MQPRAVFVDVDGTLVGAQGTIPESAVKAIRDSRAAGNLVFLATGRSTDELWDELLEIGFDGQITGSGATVEIPGETLTKVRFTPEQVDRLERDLSATGAILMYHTDTGSITSAAGQEWLRQMVRERHGDSDQSTHFGFIDFLLIDQDPRLASSRRRSTSTPRYFRIRCKNCWAQSSWWSPARCWATPARFHRLGSRRPLESSWC